MCIFLVLKFEICPERYLRDLWQYVSLLGLLFQLAISGFGFKDRHGLTNNVMSPTCGQRFSVVRVCSPVDYQHWDAVPNFKVFKVPFFFVDGLSMASPGGRVVQFHVMSNGRLAVSDVGNFHGNSTNPNGVGSFIVQDMFKRSTPQRKPWNFLQISLFAIFDLYPHQNFQSVVFVLFFSQFLSLLFWPTW